jgi:hypothetical protein
VIHVLAVLAIAAVYGLYALVKPEKTCRRCCGWGAKGKRRASCKRCGGTGTCFRFGAPLVHRGAALARRYLRERRDGR